MPGQPKKSKKRIPLVLEEKLLRAIEIQAARQKTNRTAWLTALAEEKLRDLGKWP